ncbi:MAG: SLC13 family permease, partial [Acidobacteriota bacterium]|nr:SLC13 family permease [Acidobacteriota bacterium]
SLSLSGILTLEESFAGFSNEAVITVAGVLVMSRAVQASGVIQIVGTKMIEWGKTPMRLIFMIMLVVGLISGFINDIGTAALFMPLVIMVARRIKLSPSKLLIPLSYGCLLGGTLTLIGTPPNILVTLIMAEQGYEPFKMFDFTPIGALVILTGILYMTLVGHKLLPERRGETSLMDRFKIRDYLTELVVTPKSPIVGKRLDQLDLTKELDFSILGIIRNNRTVLTQLGQEFINEGDVLLVEASPDNLSALTQQGGLEVVPDVDPDEADISSEDVEIVEAVVLPDSRLVGRSLRQIGLRRRYELTVMAISRQGESVRRRLVEVLMKEGDVLLIQGNRRKIDMALPAIGSLPLADRAISLKSGARPIRILGIFLGVILLASTGGLHVSMAFTLGAFLMVLTRCIKLREFYAAIEWPILILMAGMIPLGTAMVKTGSASWVANGLLSITGDSNPYLVLAALYLMVTALTSVLNNPTVAVVVAPIAIDLAVSLELSPLPFLMLTAVTASCAFLSPVSHKANVLVWGPGGYQFIDYARVGLPLSLLIGVVCILVIPILWPF